MTPAPGGALNSMESLSENLTRLESKLEKLDLQAFDKMLGLEQILLQLQCSMSSQMSLLHELHVQMGSNRTTMVEVQPLEHPGSLVGFRPAPILKKKVRTEEEAEHIDIPLPPQPPQKLAVLPGELKEEDRGSGRCMIIEI